MLGRQLAAIVLSVAAVAVVLMITINDADVSKLEAPFHEIPKQLAQKRKAYQNALTAAVNAKAKYDLAAREAVRRKQQLDSFKKHAAKRQAIRVRRKAAYYEVHRAAKEERKAKKIRATAEAKMKLSRKNHQQAAAAMKKAAALAKKSAADRAVAIEEVHAAAAITSGNAHSGDPHPPLQGAQLAKFAKSRRVHRAKGWSSAQKAKQALARVFAKIQSSASKSAEVSRKNYRHRVAKMVKKAKASSKAAQAAADKAADKALTAMSAAKHMEARVLEVHGNVLQRDLQSQAKASQKYAQHALSEATLASKKARRAYRRLAHLRAMASESP